MSKQWTVATSRHGDVTIHSEDGKQIEVIAREPVGGIDGTTAAGVEASQEVAERIVSCVNAHEDLVGALSRLESSARAVVYWTHVLGIDKDKDKELSDLLGDLWQEANEARAALAALAALAKCGENEEER